MTIATRVGNTFIGSPVERIEDLRFVRGRGEYVDDIVRDGMLHAAIVRSPVAHGRIRAIDTRAALAMPGVRGVLTAKEIGDPVPVIPLRQEHSFPLLEHFLQPVIAADRVRFVGEPVAIVVADTPSLAEDAADAVAVEIDPLPAQADRYAAARDETLLFEASGTNRMLVLTATRGDVEKAFAAADYRRRERFSVQRHTAVTMEARGLVAEWDEARGRLTVRGAAKLPFNNRVTLAAQMRLAEDAIELIENDVGGGFGVRGEFYPEDFLVPFAARHFRRPVKWVEDRREHFLSSNHARDLDADLEIACRKDGTILALRGTLTADMGAYLRTNGATGPRNCAQIIAGPYRVPDIHVDSVMVVTNKTPIGTYRAPGRFEADFFRERLIDMAAKDLGIDRVEFRRRNLIADAEMPWQHARMEPYGGGEYDSGDYATTFERCLREFGWTEKAGLDGKLIDGRYHGLGLGCYVEGGATGPSEDARIAVEPDGRLAVSVGSSAVGQGIETIFAQIAADALELPMSRISGVAHGSTGLVKKGVGSHASRSTVMGGSAIVLAAAALKDKLRAAAAERFGCAAAEVTLADGKAAHGAASLPYAAFAGVSAEATFRNNKRTYAYGTHAAHVAVDARTGAVEVLDYASVEDVGRIINPATLHGQVIGSIVQGLGGALIEHIVYDGDGQLLTASLADYLMPTATDVPPIRAIALEEKPSPNNPLGAKGAGEGGVIPVGGVIANAVAAALASLGVEPRALPLSPPRVWRLMRDAAHPGA